MTTETSHTHSEVLKELENIIALNQELSLSEATKLADRLGEEFRKCEPLERILKSLETETSFPRIFVVGGHAFDVSYPKPLSEMSLLERLKLRLMLMRLKLSQFVFPDSFQIRCTFSGKA